jgi:hypothetical protein
MLLYVSLLSSLKNILTRGRKHGRYCSYLASLLCLISTFSYSENSNLVVYPGTEGDYYFSLLLKHTLSYSQGEHYEVRSFGANIPKDRDFELLANNDGIDVVFAGSNMEREQKYRAVHFPILKGLNGWRIPLVRGTKLGLFSKPLSLEQFKQLKPGQFHTWSDTLVLQANGIEVVKGTNFDGLFGMLSRGRFDYFPRSVLEVESDYERHKNLNIAIDPYIIIHYPTAFYFYVNKDNILLENKLLQGLEAAHLDGTLNALFMQFYGEQVNHIKATKRRLVSLDNPLLPKETPLNRKDLWIDLH